MRVVAQRVNNAQVLVNGGVVGKIDKGLFVLVGIKKGDSEKDAETLADKLLKLRIMADLHDKMNLSVVDARAQILAVSQFTLYSNTKGGNRPSFIEAEEPEKAREIYEHFVETLRLKNVTVETGSFGQYMEISASLDGPVTIILES